MLVGAVGDIHAPLYLERFVQALGVLREGPDLFLFAGDITERGRIGLYAKVVEAVRSRFGCPVFACLGNTEYDEHSGEVRSAGVELLQEEAKVLEDSGGRKILIVGSRGVLDSPTVWQRTHIPGVESLYAERARKLKELLSREADVKILLTHYATTYGTLEGERPEIYPSLGTRTFEEFFRNNRVISIHAHAHLGRPEARIGPTRIFNVSLPLRGCVTLLRV